MIQKLGLSYIPKLFLNISNFEPQHFYKLCFYKKKKSLAKMSRKCLIHIFVMTMKL